MKNQTRFLQRVYVALTNTLNTPELLAALAEFNYDAKKVRQGLSLYQRVEELTQQREQAQEAQYQATQLLTDAKERLLSLFKIHVDTARLSYRREASSYQDTLGLTRTTPRDTASCLKHIKRFYAHVPPVMMAKYHVPQKELHEGIRLADRVQELLALKTKATSQPQHLSALRQQALEELQTWMRRFDKITQLALEDQPQQREALGRTVR